MKASLILIVALVNWSVLASGLGHTVKVKSKNETSVTILYDSIDTQSNKPYIYADHISVLVNGPRVYLEDKIEVFIDTFVWGVWPSSSETLSVKLNCKAIGEAVTCSAYLSETISLLVYDMNVQHELRVKVNGSYLINPWPMLQNPSGERFHLYLAK